MTTEHIKQIYFNGETYIIILHSNAIITGFDNLAQSILEAGKYCYPKPELSKGSQVLDPVLEAS